MEIELQFLDWIQTFRTPAGDFLMCAVSTLGNAGVIWIALAVILLLFSKTRKSGVVMLAALCVDIVLCNGIMKNLFCRIRPCDVNTTIQLLIPRPDDFSFPSGHTASSFAAVTALYVSGQKKLCKYFLVLAAGIAFSRLYLYVHYPTDILGGVLIGIAAGDMGCWIIRKLTFVISHIDKTHHYDI